MNTAGKLLAIDCSTSTGQVAVWHKDGYAGVQLAGGTHGDQLLPTVDRLLKENNLTLGQLEAIAVVNGPGSLTGIRLGCATGQALAYAANLPVIRLHALVALAWDQLMYKDGMVLLDARMRRVFWTAFRCGEWQRAEMDSRRLGVDKLRNYAKHWKAYGVTCYHGRQDTLDAIGIAAQSILPSVENLANYAIHKLRAGAQLPPQSLLPEYLGEWSAD